MNLKSVNPRAHVIESQQFDIDFLEELCDLTLHMKQNRRNVGDELAGKNVLNMFWEASSRTALSFVNAAQYLGAKTTLIVNAGKFSSASKGETLEDTIRVSSAYTDFLVVRHNHDDASEQCYLASRVPTINAGSGKSQHPTQALLDFYTIKDHFKRTDNLSITFVGDLLRGRTVKSLTYLMAKFPGNSFNFVAPDNSRIDDGIKTHLNDLNVAYIETEDLLGTLKKSDIVYMTRVQKERFGSNPERPEELTPEENAEYERARDMYKIDRNNINLIPCNSILMHPLPRLDEISKDVDHDERAKYFIQADNGLYVRMALFKMMNDYNYR